MKQFASYILTVIALLLNISVSAQIPPNIKPVPMQRQDTLQQVIMTSPADFEISKDPKNDRVVYKGIFSYRDMENEPTFSWMTTGMDEYKPDAAAMDYLKKHIGNYKLLIYIGTWCGDSKDLFPKLYKILQQLNVSYEDIMIAGMDRDKTTITREGKKLAKKYKIKLLPTFILLNKDGKEAGRIVESVNKSVEEDMVEIMKGDK